MRLEALRVSVMALAGRLYFPLDPVTSCGDIINDRPLAELFLARCLGKSARGHVSCWNTGV